MDNNQLYSIGDVTRRTGLSVSAVRFYADTGIVTPTDHTDAGYRLYDLDAIARLELVRTLRELDTPLDDIRRLLADETTLRDLATAHLAVVESQLHRLQARRAVLRTIVNQHSTTEQLSLMTKLVSLSDEDRDQLVDAFWTEVTEGLDNVHPTFVELMRKNRPTLPAEPTTEQLEAWIELADLLQDKDFRHTVREYFHDTLATARARVSTAPPGMERMKRYLEIRLEARAARLAGLPADSAPAQEIATRLVAALAEATGQPDLAEVRRQVATFDSVRARSRPDVVRYGELLGRYNSLVATINGLPRTDPTAGAADQEWLTTALTPSHE